MKLKAFLARPDKRLRLKDYDPGYTAGYDSEESAKERLQENVERLAKYQDLLCAEGSYALLVVLQAMFSGGFIAVCRNAGASVSSIGRTRKKCW
jgi:hypothetical protein